MNKKIMSVLIGIGMGIGALGGAQAAVGCTNCTHGYQECVAGGTDTTTCTRLYNKCINLNWDCR